MSTYDYRCKKCAYMFEKTMSITDHERSQAPVCPKCKSKEVEQIPSRFQAVTSKKT